MRKDKRYTMIITSEDERYAKGMSLSHFAENPADGLLVDITFGNTFDELYRNGEHEGLFYQLYETGTGRRIGAGVLEPDGPAEEIKVWERDNLTLENFRPYTNNSKVIGHSIYTVFLKDNGWTIREDNPRPDIDQHSAILKNATYDLRVVLDYFNSITGELEIIGEPLDGGVL